MNHSGYPYFTEDDLLILLSLVQDQRAKIKTMEAPVELVVEYQSLVMKLSARLREIRENR